MIECHFIAVDNLFNQTNTPVIIEEPIEYSFSALNSADIFFDEYSPQQVELIFDFGYLLPFVEGALIDTTGNINNLLFRYGVKIYDGSSLKFTGCISVESIKINYNSFTIKMTALDNLATLALVEREKDLGLFTCLTTDEDTGIRRANSQQLINEIMLNLWSDLGLTHMESFFVHSPGQPLPLDAPVAYAWSDYLNDFPLWQVTPQSATGNYTLAQNYSMVKIGMFPDNNDNDALYIFMLKAVYYIDHFQNANDQYKLRYKWKRVKIDYENPLQVLEFDSNENQVSRFTPIANPLYDVSGIHNIQAYIDSTNTDSYSFGITSTSGYVFSYRIYYVEALNTGIFYFDGTPPEITSFVLNPEWLGKENKLFRIVNEITMLKQCVLVSDNEGRIVQTLRPSLAGASSYTEVSRNIVIEDTLDSIILRQNYTDKYDWIQSGNTYIDLLKNYYARIIAKYHRKRIMTISGVDLYHIAQGIRYSNHDYIITSIRPDYANYLTELEAYGEV